MQEHDIIIVGGGPAGSTCAWKLREHGRDCIILDKQPFPRPKACAGWIPPAVVRDLRLSDPDYPHQLYTLEKFLVYIYGIGIRLRTRQYAIRRQELDHWLITRSTAPLITHRVRRIDHHGDRYIIDDQFRCRVIIGAGGTYCPVYRTFFRDIQKRDETSLIAALAAEFPHDNQDQVGRLWFFQNNLPGYSWYLPKGPGILNIGLGGSAGKMAARGTNLASHWKHFINYLEKQGLLGDRRIAPRGYGYYWRQDLKTAHIDNAYLVGDSAGLATRDLGEGIGPAVQSGLLAARSIITATPYSLKTVRSGSIYGLVFPGGAVSGPE